MRKPFISRLITSTIAITLYFSSINLLAQNAYITNNGSHNVSVINTATNTVIATIPSIKWPDAVVVSPDGLRAYVTYSTYPGIFVSVINTVTNAVIDSIFLGLGSFPDGIDISPDGSKLYATVSGGSGDTVFVINTLTRNVIKKFALPLESSVAGVAVNPNGSKVYVAYRDSIMVINASDNSLGTPVALGTGVVPYGIAVTPDGSKIYATSYDESKIFVVNTATNSVTSGISTGSASYPWGVAINPDGSKVYVSAYFNDAVYVVNTSTDIITDTIPVGENPYGLAIVPDGSKVYVANAKSNNVYVINTATNTIIDSATVGVRPIAFGKFIGPAPGKLCAGGNGILTSNLTGVNYQWQLSTDFSNFNNLVDDANYSGVHSSILQLTNIPSAWYGYKYRCIVDGVNGSVNTLHFTNTWMGSSNTDWQSPSNWTCGVVPDANTDVIVNSGNVFVNSNATCRSLKVSPNANVTVNAGVTLTVTH